MGNQIFVNPQAIEQHGKDVGGAVKDALTKAGDTLNAYYNLEGGSFSITCTAAAMAYPGAIQFAFQDLRTHLGMLDQYSKNLATSAKNYQGAEDASKMT
jgi:uncharacterized protein YukE